MNRPTLTVAGQASEVVASDGSVVLNKLVFVFDARQRHDRQILRYVKKFLQENPHLDPQLVMEEIVHGFSSFSSPDTKSAIFSAGILVMI